MARETILIVDDEELNRALLRQIFEHKYDIIEARDGKEAILKLGEHIDQIVVILLDIVMPVLNGYQVLQILHARDILKRIPIVLITAQADAQGEITCYTLGAAAIINKPFSPQVVRTRVTNIIETQRNVRNLEEAVRDQNTLLNQQQIRLESFYDMLLDSISNIVEFRNLESGMHVKRVKGLTRVLALACMQLFPEYGLDPDRINTIVRAAAIHDIGKIAIPDRILLKPGRLTQEEREVMMEHTTKGCQILNLLAEVQDSEQFKVSYEVCRHHHERFDGSGYPDGLKGNNIPLSAQLVSIADVYDALVSERVYKKPVDKEKAYQMILDGECGVFSPDLMTCFVHSKDKMEALFLEEE